MVVAEKSPGYSALEAVKAIFVPAEHALNISYFSIPVGKSRATFFLSLEPTFAVQIMIKSCPQLVWQNSSIYYQFD